MKNRVVFTGDFRGDLKEQTRWLLEWERPEWAERLWSEIEALAVLLARSPGAGAIEVDRGGRQVRRLILRRLPFVAWYHWQKQSRTVVVLRLFHVRQSRASRRR